MHWIISIKQKIFKLKTSCSKAFLDISSEIAKWIWWVRQCHSDRTIIRNIRRDKTKNCRLLLGSRIYHKIAAIIMNFRAPKSRNMINLWIKVVLFRHLIYLIFKVEMVIFKKIINMLKIIRLFEQTLFLFRFSKTYSYFAYLC